MVAGAGRGFNKVFVGGVPPTCTEEKFDAYFRKWKGVNKTDLRDGKGYGFVTFNTEEDM